ncbi:MULTISPECIES: type II toxin-antitoxin system Phd/YefM family antitoxin [unclassified Bradyrhizobium]|uniref:type II toxin-antitoxin system Phd/YefM family antitoxin n=1 Tax=unclassified Bradyrhizobium TaxID=2631580 RepID=UPI002916C45F|nr:MULTISPECIES: type II toxin-antitoxin system Phd/YefM family antitoxin [unclassified Bradyrhizobium]
MRLDFIPLSMTELRTRPGEILDRVAEDHDAFLIERNGRQRACLVPISVFLPDISPARIARELDELEKCGEMTWTTITQEKEVAIRVKHSHGEKAYSIIITLPHNYPNSCPRVYVDDIDQNAPHRFTDGALCIFGVMSSWNPGRHTARDALVNARHWLDRYESWQHTGFWPQMRTSDGR